MNVKQGLMNIEITSEETPRLLLSQSIA